MLDLIGRTLGHYRIVEQLGEGGMGVVYKAEDTRLGRTVALKFLPPEWSRDPDARERFFREARAASALEDSRACTIFDIDETEDGQLFIAMAYYEGETLKKRLERGQLSTGRSVDIAIQVAEGLESAHSADIIHRDIKPANLMLTGHDEVVIVDFGLAKLAGDLTLTKPGSSLGTPLYMSPEQSRGEPIDRRTDLWSLGVVLHEMLTGRPPFVGENHAAVARAILDDEPAPLTDLRPEAPVELGEVVAKTLAKDPSSRYQSAGELLTDLRNLREQIVDVEGVTLSTPSQRSLRRRSLLPVVLAAGVVILGAAAVLWTGRSTGPQEAVNEPPPRIVVLPFENLGPPEDEYFADGVTEEITSRLAAVSGLRVISRTSAMYYKDRQVPLRQIGEELDVGFVLEGTIRWDRGKQGVDRVRITPQLIRVADDSHLWSDRYDRVLDEVFAVQSDIAEQVIDQLRATLLDSERRTIEARPTDNMEAYAAYLRAVHSLWGGFGPQGALLAVEQLRRAVDLDPDFARAFAVLSESHSKVYHQRADFTDKRLASAKIAANRALELQPDLPEGHRALGFYYLWGFHDYDRAREHFLSAIERIPRDESTLLGLSAIQKRQGRWDEAVETLEKLQEIDPRSPASWVERAIVFTYLRRYDEAAKAAEKAIELSPDSVQGYYWGAVNYLNWEGTTDNARRLLEASPDSENPWVDYLSFLLDYHDRRPERALLSLQANPADVISTQDWFIPKNLLECMCHAEMGEKTRAEVSCASAAELLQREIVEKPHDYRLHAMLGHALALLGSREEAIASGEKAVELMPVSKDAIVGPAYELDLAKILTCVGERGRAIKMLDELLSIPGVISVPLLRLDPVWDPLRDHPRFQVMLEEYGGK